MSTTQIENVLKNNCTTAPYFEGVYALDRLPRYYIFNRPALVVCNTAYSGSGGEHWVAFFLHRGGVQFFDSYGFAPKGQHMTDFINLNSSSRGAECNTVQLQSLNSSTCGKYAATFLYCRCNGLTMQQYVELLGYRPDKNVRKLFKDIFGDLCGSCREGDQKCYKYGCRCP